jgi:AspT/YidE/YbjL antiporter-like protein
MGWIAAFLEGYPELAVFLAIGIGYVFGGITFGGFAFGPVTGSLFAGLLIGQFAEAPVSPMAKSFLFLMFLFGIGYSVGPQFLQSLKKGGVQAVLMSVVCTVTGLATALTMARILGLDAGFAAGLLSGALTQSAAMGTATEAIGSLPLDEAAKAALVSHVAIADALCYVFGAAMRSSSRRRTSWCRRATFSRSADGARLSSRSSARGPRRSMTPNCSTSRSGAPTWSCRRPPSSERRWARSRTTDGPAASISAPSTGARRRCRSRQASRSNAATCCRSSAPMRA